MTDEWSARDERVTRERLAIFAAQGASQVDPDIAGFVITAVPEIPDDDHPEGREFYVEVRVLNHVSPTNGTVTGIGTRKYRILLEEITNE